MRGNSHVRFLGEGWSVMVAPYPTAVHSLSVTIKALLVTAGLFYFFDIHETGS